MVVWSVGCLFCTVRHAQVGDAGSNQVVKGEALPVLGADQAATKVCGGVYLLEQHCGDLHEVTFVVVWAKLCQHLFASGHHSEYHPIDLDRHGRQSFFL